MRSKSAGKQHEETGHDAFKKQVAEQCLALGEAQKKLAQQQSATDANTAVVAKTLSAARNVLVAARKAQKRAITASKAAAAAPLPPPSKAAPPSPGPLTTPDEASKALPLPPAPKKAKTEAKSEAAPPPPPPAKSDAASMATPPRTSVFEKGDRLAVSHPLAPRWQWGRTGTVISQAGDTVTYTPDDAFHKKEFVEAGLAEKNPAPRAKAAQKKKPVNWFSAEQMVPWKLHWETAVPFEGMQPTRQTQLDLAEIQAGICEVLWRTLPPSLVCVPVDTARFVAETDASNVLPEEEAHRQRALHLFRVAHTVVAPLWGAGPGHWVLWVAERVGVAPTGSQAAVSDAPAASAGSVRSLGCHACKFTRCATCDPTCAEMKLKRSAAEALVLDQASRPHLGR